MTCKSRRLMPLVLMTCLLLIQIAGCSRQSESDPVLDFDVVTMATSDSIGATTNLRVAVAAITGPRENYRYYSKLVDFVAKKSGTTASIVQRKTYSEVNNLLQRGEVDLAFVCSGGYIQAAAEGSVELLCAPEVNGRVTYQSYLIVPEKSSYSCITDLEGKVFAYTDPLSNTGCMYPRWLLKKAGHDPDVFFEKVVFTHGHDNSIQSVARGVVDGAAVDALIYDYLRKKRPLAIAGTKVVHMSLEFGIPPVVTRKGLSSTTKARLLDALVGMDQDSTGSQILGLLNIDRFVVVGDSLYDSIRLMNHEFD